MKKKLCNGSVINLTSYVEGEEGGYVAGLMSSVTKSSHTGWSDHELLTGQVIVGTHILVL